MNIGIIGNGGREHALCQKICASKKANNIYCFPGNAGTSKIAINTNIDYLKFKKFLAFIKLKKIDLIIVGPEQPLVKGIVDFLEKNNIKVFGPNKFAAKLEGSKAFMKLICKKYQIPTASFKICKNVKDVKIFLKDSKFPTVVKADGLAAGKGVFICKNKKHALKISGEIFSGKFKSSKKLVIEEFLEGEELSYFVVVDKKNYAFIGSAQDHKRVGENDTGPNTGGMGAYSPAPAINNELNTKIINRIVKPTLKGLKRSGNPYTGFLYVGLMIKDNNPYLIEFNVRMGDPECQVILPRIKNDFLDIIFAAVENNLSKIKIKWKMIKCMTIVLCSRGYPHKYKKNKEIKNIHKIRYSKNLFIFHAGTKKKNNKIISTGGRVLNITGTGNSFLKIRKNIIKLIRKINWKYGFYRKDIGNKVI